MTSRLIPLEIDTILRRYDSALDDDHDRSVARGQAIEALDAVAVKIDPEQDLELLALVDAARRRVASDR